MSEKQTLANRQNAVRSTGPRTEVGKARSRLNALKHGGYARVCTEGEDPARFKALRLNLLAEYRPRGFEENLLISEIAETLWRKNRFKAAETQAIEAYSYGEFGRGEEKGDVALAIAQDAAAWSVIPRCLAAEGILDRRLWRLFDRFDRLRTLQKERGYAAGSSPDEIEMAVVPANDPIGHVDPRERPSAREPLDQRPGPPVGNPVAVVLRAPSDKCAR